jgi:hypothetical protein
MFRTGVLRKGEAFPQLKPAEPQAVIDQIQRNSTKV